MTMCPLCGITYEDGGYCQLDGTPLIDAPAAPPPDEESAPPPPAPAARQPAAKPPDRPKPPAPRPKRHPRAMLIAIIGVACVVLAGGAITTLTLLANSGGPSGMTNNKLLVTGIAPTAPSAWASGYQTAWHEDPMRQVQSQNPDLRLGSVFFAARDADRIAYDIELPAEPITLLVDAATGRRVWQQSGTEWGCVGAIVGDELLCATGKMGVYPTERYDLATGEPGDLIDPRSLGLPVPDSRQDRYDYWGVSFMAGLPMVTYSEKPDPVCGDSRALARLSDDGTAVMWKTSYPSSFCSEDVPRTSVRLHHGVLTNSQEFAVNAGSGDVIASCPEKTACAIEWVADNVLMAGPAETSEAMTFPDGTDGFRVGPGAISVTSTLLPPNPLRWKSGRVEAFDSQTGQAVWSTAASLSAPGIDPRQPGTVAGLYAAYNGHEVIVTDTLGHASAFDVATGRRLWQLATAVGSLVTMPDFTPDGALLLSQLPPENSFSDSPPDAQLIALDPATGTRWWSKPGQVAGTRADQYPVLDDEAGYDDLLVENPDATYTMLKPKPRSASNIPAEASDCPSSATPVAWTRYADGSVLVCQDNLNGYSVEADSEAAAASLTFADGGFTVGFRDQTRVRADLGGSLVTVTQGQRNTTYVATQSWSVATGTSSFANTPAGLAGCAAEANPASLSTWAGGWLLVCGSSAAEPTRLVFDDGAAGGEATSVVATGDSYCGGTAAGRACVYRTPAVVTIGDRQHAVLDNFFVGFGHGGAGLGSGAYGVPAPAASAADQVRYLVDLLNKSKADRTALGPVSQDVIECANLEDAAKQLAGIKKNREDLLLALNSTPVDRIANGASILADLRAAVAASRDADQAWADWADQRRWNDCGPRPPAVDAAQAAVDKAKKKFCDEWKTEVADVYGVKAFTRDEI